MPRACTCRTVSTKRLSGPFPKPSRNHFGCSLAIPSNTATRRASKLPGSLYSDERKGEILGSDGQEIVHWVPMLDRSIPYSTGTDVATADGESALVIFLNEAKIKKQAVPRQKLPLFHFLGRSWFNSNHRIAFVSVERNLFPDDLQRGAAPVVGWLDIVIRIGIKSFV
jgi:hypothetical protein